jgi:hypothetical protein
MISRIGYRPECPDTEGCRAFHAAMTGSINAHHSSDRSLRYDLRDLSPSTPMPPTATRQRPSVNRRQRNPHQPGNPHRGNP